MLLRIWSDILGKYRLKGVVLNYSPIQPQSQANYPWYKHSIYGILDSRVTLKVNSVYSFQAKFKLKIKSYHDLGIQFQSKIVISVQNVIRTKNPARIWSTMKHENNFAWLVQTKFKPFVKIKLGPRLNLPHTAVWGYQIRTRSWTRGKLTGTQLNFKLILSPILTFKDR